MKVTLSKISVIVPIYKIEPYLHQCVDSILAQTYTNLEIILVDDGSPDNCGKICDEYAEKDNRIIVIHKENGGLSDARNAGIDIATGEYLLFIDSDDWIEHDTIELLYTNLIHYSADISMCSYFNTYVDYNIPLCNDKETMVLTSEQAIEECYKGKKFTVSAWGKLYKKYFFENIRYPFGKYCEDAFVIVDILSKANIIIGETIPKFYYRQRKGSIMKDMYQSKTMDVIEAFEQNLKIIEEKYPNIIDMAKDRLMSVNLGVLRMMLFSKNYKKIPEYKKVLSTLRKNYKFIINSDYFTKNEKIKIRALKINVKLYKLLQAINDWKKKNITEKDKILFE